MLPMPSTGAHQMTIGSVLAIIILSALIAGLIYYASFAPYWWARIVFIALALMVGGYVLPNIVLTEYANAECRELGWGRGHWSGTLWWDSEAVCINTTTTKTPLGQIKAKATK